MPFGIHGVKKETLQKYGQKIQDKASKFAKDAVVQAATAAAPTRLVDERLKNVHERLGSLQATYSELYSALKHQVLNARKMSKCVRETDGPMTGLCSLVGQDSRRSVQTAMAVDAAIARSWDEYAQNLEAELLAPAKQECNALFSEGDQIWSGYIATINEMAARQGKERYLGADQKATALLEKKAYAETSKLPRLTSLCEAVEAAICFLVSRHQLLHASLHRDAYGAATSSTGDNTKPLDESSKIISETRDGWRQLSTASGASSSSTGGGGYGGAPPPPRSVFDVPLDALAMRPESIQGVPLIAHLMIYKLLCVPSPINANSSFYEIEGLFRIQADAEDCEYLKRNLDQNSTSPANTQQIIYDVNDPHVLATSLKQWLRKLPSPLIPSQTYRSIVALGQQSMQQGGGGGGGGNTRGSVINRSVVQPLNSILASGLPPLIRSLPQPNLFTLNALVELLEAVASKQELTLMGPSNLALVFAPTICRSEGGLNSGGLGGELAVEIPSAAHVLAELITHRADCFPPGLPSVTAVAPPLWKLWLEAEAPAASAPTPPPPPPPPPPEEEEEEEAPPPRLTRRESAANEVPNWWYSASGEQVGPVTSGALAALLANGEVSLSTWVFEGGTADWQELSVARQRLPRVATL